jgi:ATP-dependent exoDNAse (exonuclease V) beta subunit
LTPPPRVRLDEAAETRAVEAARALTTLAEIARSRTRPPLVAATALAGERLTAGDGRSHGTRAARTPEVPARLVGTAVHALLERADFAGGGALLAERVLEDVCVDTALAAGIEPEALTRRVKPLWTGFEGSQLRRRLARTVILARELPILAPSSMADPRPMTGPIPNPRQAGSAPGPQLCTGVADLVFEEDGRWIVADWKTDDVKSEEDLTAAVERHGAQVRFYAGALSRVSRRPVEAEIFFVRVDRGVRL